MAGTATPKGKTARGSAGASIARWLFFGVGLALIPIALNGVGALTRQERGFTFEDLFARGELLLLAAAVVGAALAELFDQARPRFRTLRLVTGGSSFLLICGASVWFADIAAGGRDNTRLDGHFIAVGSLWIFGLALIAGISCLVLAELEAPPVLTELEAPDGP
jgi:hypothetical protein